MNALQRVMIPIFQPTGGMQIGGRSISGNERSNPVSLLLVSGWIVLVGGLEGCSDSGQSRTTVQVKSIKLVQ